MLISRSISPPYLAGHTRTGQTALVCRLGGHQSLPRRGSDPSDIGAPSSVGRSPLVPAELTTTAPLLRPIRNPWYICRKRLTLLNLLPGKTAAGAALDVAALARVTIVVATVCAVARLIILVAIAMPRARAVPIVARAPIVASVVPERMLINVAVVVVGAQTQMRPTIIMMVGVVTAVVGMASITIVMQVQMTRVPADTECRRHTPEVSGGECVVRRVGVVIHRIAARVVVIHGITVIRRHPRRLIIRYIDHLGISERDFYGSVARHLHDLMLIAFKITRHPCKLAEVADRGNDFFLLNQHRLAKLPRPVEVVVHQLEHFGVVQQRND